jgi:murein tripeptide amidase MpaA
MAAPKTSFEDSISSNPQFITLVEESSFLQEIVSQSSRVSYASLGPSVGNRPINLIRVGYPNAPTDDELKEKSVVMLIAEQHGDEPAGREALLQYVRDLAFSTEPSVQQYLSRHPIILVPTCNPDNLNNARLNLNGMDTNRDWLRQSQPETRAVSSAFRDFSPVIF